MSKTPAHMVKKLAARRQFSAAMTEEGGSLVEMALSCLILIPILFGIVQLSIGLYCFHYAADAAREATRWAIVRGASCNTNFGTAYCSPTDAKAAGATGNDIAQYVKGLGYPYSGAVTTTTQWCVASTSTSTSTTSWSSCSTTQDNEIGNQVQVTVSYAYPLVIPFVKKNTLNITSVSSMTIVQ